MRINEVLNSKNYIVEDDKRGMRDAKIINDFLANAARVGAPGAKAPEVIAKARDTSKKKAEEKASKRAFFMFQEDILKYQNQNS